MVGLLLCDLRSSSRHRSSSCPHAHPLCDAAVTAERLDPSAMKNMATIPDVDHGKTPLMDRLLCQCGADIAHERAMGMVKETVMHPEDLYVLVKVMMATDRVRKQIPPDPCWAFCYSILQNVSVASPLSSSNSNLTSVAATRVVATQVIPSSASPPPTTERGFGSLLMGWEGQLSRGLARCCRRLYQGGVPLDLLTALGVPAKYSTVSLTEEELLIEAGSSSVCSPSSCTPVV